jgi:hypothetical protein
MENVIKGMIAELDWLAEEYLQYTDEVVKESIATEFKIFTSAYNRLLRTQSVENTRFPRKIVKYIQQRNEEDWE